MAMEMKMASPLPIMLELAIEFSSVPAAQPPPVRNVGLWYCAHESDANAFGMLLQASQTFYTFTVPFGAESVLWATFKSKESGLLLNIWHHTHVTEGFAEQWLITANPSALGLEQGRLRLNGCNTAFCPADVAMTADEVRLTILENMREQGLRFRCLWREPNIEWVETVPNMSGVRPAWYGRQTHVECFEGSQRISAGEYLTNVVFWDTRGLSAVSQSYLPQSNKGLQLTGVEQHLHFQGYIVHDRGTSDMNYLFGGKYDSYSWTSYPMQPATFYCAFGSKFSTPFVCGHELPGCSEPRYPEPSAPLLLRAAFASWAALVYLSYFYTAPFFGAQLLGGLLLVYCICIRRVRCSSAHSRTSGSGVDPVRPRQPSLL